MKNKFANWLAKPQTQTTPEKAAFDMSATHSTSSTPTNFQRHDIKKNDFGEICGAMYRKGKEINNEIGPI